MADRYWVGGTGSWTTSSTANWSASPGGASGASVPTAADSVFFDQAGTYTVTLTGALTCLDFNVSAGAITFTSTGGVTISGSMSITNVTPTWSTTGGVGFNSTTTGRTITTNGISFSTGISFNGVGGEWTLGSSLTTTGGFSVANGTVDTSAVGNYGITTSSLSATGGTLNLNGSTVATTGQVCIDFAAGATLNAGTSQINCTVGAGLTYQLRGGGKTYYNVAFNTASATTVIVTGANTFNNFSVTGPSTVGATKPVTFAANQIINGVLSTNGTAGNRRLIFTSATVGIQFDLAINSTPSLTDADFRDLRITGTAAPISGTRIGDLRGCSGITFATKTVYWNLPAGGNWTATAWAPSSGGTVSDDNFPLPQDTAVIENTGLNTSATITLNTTGSDRQIGTIDISGRTTAMTLASTTGAGLNHYIYGDLKLSTSVTIPGSFSVPLNFIGRNTQTITSAGRTFTSANFAIDSPGGTVELADALNISTSTLTVTNGMFDTKNFNVTAGILSSSNSNVRTINLGSSTVTLSQSQPLIFTSAINLTFNTGTSSIVCTNSQATVDGGNQIFYNMSFTNTGSSFHTINQSNTFNNLSITAPSSAGVREMRFTGNQTITDTLTCAGITVRQRLFLSSNTLGTTRTLTVNSLSATDCDFRDITIAGTAAGSSPTRAGDCGGNSGITFPAAKTVYWNLAGSQDWSSIGWCPSSGGTPDINNFPLAQDTAVFDNTGAITGVATNAVWNIGTVNMSGRTTAMEWSSNFSSSYYGNWLFGTGVTTLSNSGTQSFVGRGTQTITSNGVTINNPVNIDCITGTVQLADALILASARTLTLTSGTFNAVTYNVTSGAFSSDNSNTRTLRMGTGTWTLGATGTIWDMATTSNLLFYKDSANIVLSSISTSTRAFDGGSLSYNKLTIGGTTGISTLNMSGNNQFTELASTKTVAHTIALGTTNQTFGKWSVTGTAGNVVTVNGTGTTHVIAGARVTDVDYLAMGSTIGFSTTSPGEFYAGVNSTGTGAGVILTAAPAPVTRYWVGGTGTWNTTTTTNWSDTSGGAGGFSVPTSADAVIFDSASNATAYTVTLTATQLRCGSLTMAGPASGNLTWAGNAPLAIHDNVTLAATGITRTYNATIVLSGSTAGKTLTTNNLQPTNLGVQINGVGCGWSLGSAANFGTNSGLNVINGSFDTANYAFTVANFTSSNSNLRSLTLGSSTITMSGSSTAINFGQTPDAIAGFTFNAGTSQINISVINLQISCNGQTFHNVNLTGSGITTITIRGANTFNNLTVTGSGTVGVRSVTFLANQTINGTLTFSAGLNAQRRSLVRSNTFGTAITLTCAAFSGTDVDFRDITIAGAAAPISGTRLGDCGGNSGITTTPKTVYWNLVAGGNWTSTAWATGSLGTPNDNNFPLAQDTVIIENAGLNTSASISIDWSGHIGTIDMSTRTNAMTLAFNANPFVYGDWTFGTGVTPSASGIPIFSKRGIQTITSNGKQFPNEVRIDSINGTVQLADALDSFHNFSLTSGTFDAVSYNVTCRIFSSTGTATRTLSLGSGLITTRSSGNQWNVTSTGLTFNKGTANIVATAETAATSFVGAGLTYNKFTIAGGTNASLFSMTGNNTFSEIASTRTVAYTFGLSSTTQRVGAFTVSGSAGNRVTITGTSAAAPVTLIFTGATFANLDYIIPTFVKVYDINSDWYAGDNSINGGSYGWIFAAGAVVASAINGQFFAFF